MAARAIQCRFENKTLWLTQALIGELFEKDLRTTNEHLVNIFDEGELRREATIREFRIFRTEGKQEVARAVRCARPNAGTISHSPFSHSPSQARVTAARLSSIR